MTFKNKNTYRNLTLAAILTTILITTGVGVAYATTTVTENLIVDGEVGIGTSSPERSLHVKGDVIRLDRDAPTPEFMMTYWDEGYNNLWKTFSLSMSASGINDGSFHILDRGTTTGGGGATSRLTISNDGNVGIGTSTPDYKLDVNGLIRMSSGDHQIALTTPGGETGIVFNGDSLGDYSRFNMHNHDDTSMDNRFFALTYNRGGYDDLVIRHNGNVGIGTKVPNSALQVSGYIQLDTSSGVPSSSDCNNTNEVGRMKVDSTASSNKLYVCTPSGWVTK